MASSRIGHSFPPHLTLGSGEGYIVIRGKPKRRRRRALGASVERFRRYGIVRMCLARGLHRARELQGGGEAVAMYVLLAHGLHARDGGARFTEGETTFLFGPAGFGWLDKG